MKIILFVLAGILSAAQPEGITGTFKYPDGTLFNGKAIFRLTRTTVTNTCTTPAQAMAFQPITAKITNGVLGTMNLYSTECLLPAGTKYQLTIIDTTGTVIAQTRCTVPKLNDPTDVSEMTCI